MAKNLRAKFGYLNYDEIPIRIEKGELTIFDIVYTKDSHEVILITPELELLPIKSKVYCYPDVNTAESMLNKATDSYPGQVVSILSGEEYLGYIVNQTTGGIFYVSPLSSKNNANLDYDTLGNKPIINLVGTYEEPILVESLEDGTYSIKGQYKISEQIETIYLSATGLIFVVETIDGVTYVKRISAKEIVDYVITENNIEVSTIATTAYIESCGYVTEKYVDEKITALNYITKEEVTTYVTELIENSINEIIDAKIDDKIDEKIEAQVTEKVEVKVNEVLDEVIVERIDKRIEERLQETEDDSILDLFA